MPLFERDVDVGPAAVGELREFDDRVVGDVGQEADYAKRNDDSK